MKNSYKIIFITIILISILAITTIAANGLFLNTSDEKGCLNDTCSNNNISNVSGINWNENFQSAISESEKTNKPMFVYFEASWCPYCKQLESETFTNQDVQNKIAENYIPVKVDGNSNPELCSRYNVFGFPTIVIIDSNGEKLDVIKGFHSPSELLNKIS